jgi:hypothetical protein
LDGIQTVYLLGNLGTDMRSEANPLMRGLLEAFGFGGMWAIKFVMLGLLAVFLTRISKRVMGTVGLAMSVVVAMNSYQCFRCGFVQRSDSQVSLVAKYEVIDLDLIDR